MENQSSQKFETSAEKIGAMLKKAQQEIEQMALQFSLGKAEASDIYEQIKMEFTSKVNEWTRLWSDLTTPGSDKTNQLKTKLEELQIQLTMGKVQAKEFFDEQTKKILQLVSEIETELKSNPSLKTSLDEFRNEASKLKLKFEILRLKFELKRFELKDDFKDEMTHAKIHIDKIFAKVGNQVDEAKEKYADFSDEVDLAFKHLKKAVKSL